MTFDQQPRSTPKLRLIGIVWGVVGVIAIVVGLIAHVAVVAIFGVMALVAGAFVYAAQAYREASAERTQRRIAGGPVSPRAAPPTPGAPQPMPEPTPTPGGPMRRDDGTIGRPAYRRRPWLRGERKPEGSTTTSEQSTEDSEPSEDIEETFQSKDSPHSPRPPGQTAADSRAGVRSDGGLTESEQEIESGDDADDDADHEVADADEYDDDGTGDTGAR